ncbi:hypothetical protein A2482_00745 [Candidatus Falkowbacteria bacterium RIFOXYC2_FULL_48_21]|uniref:Spore protein YkvP/CgeB glycosyl transferase-like domain-containing protein n=1 Tax=Candidatus Falkowbacteria bacterium RIFOXYC2_FULL_48_21 TaxID=1798005 RepID=A0A1F5T5Q8_9BACT|nr:MAG: hypothetical protein A2482_00745 [Candidatus Falkowbacteria bacterium RIFOXYC2_FULL_48_21]
MSIKETLKKISLINDLNAAFKARCQERLARIELQHYWGMAERAGIKILDKTQIAVALRARFAARGISVTAKPVGQLNLYFVCGINNWEAALPIALCKFGTVHLFDWRAQGFDLQDKQHQKERAALNRALLIDLRQAHKQHRIDLLIGYFTDKVILPETLMEISRLGIPLCNFDLDDKLWFKNVKNLVSAIDLNLTNAPECLVKYFACGGLAMFWPEAADPEIHKAYDVPFKYDVSFVGKKYGYRPKFIERLRQRGIMIKTFGEGWGGERLTNDAVIKLYSESRINLGFGGVGHSHQVFCLKGRDFEVPMSSGLYLTQDNPELALVYKIGEEILTYHDATDCANIIQHYLNHPEDAAKVRNAGYERAFREHKWEDRFRDLFCLMGSINLCTRLKY